MDQGSVSSLSNDGSRNQSTTTPRSCDSSSYTVRSDCMVAMAMTSAFDNQPHSWQLKVIYKLCRMCPFSTLLLVRPTGGGKSAVRNTFAVLTAGVSLTITPLLSLSADQVKKLKNASQAHGHVVSFHLDEIRNPQRKRWQVWDA